MLEVSFLKSIRLQLGVESMAVAITHESSWLFSLLSKYYSQDDCESFLALLSVVLFDP